MLTKGLRDEENERINNILKKLMSLVYLPENWNTAAFDEQLKNIGFSLESLVDCNTDTLLEQLQKLHFDWPNSEQFADFLLLLAQKNTVHKSTLSAKAIAVYDYIQKESKIFSFEIFNKIAAAKTTL